MNDDIDTDATHIPWSIRPVVIASSMGADGLRFDVADMAAEKEEDLSVIAQILIRLVQIRAQREDDD